jgi:ubiquinone biosynthesis protein UbiJ
VRRVVMVQDKLAAKQFEAGVLNEDRVEIDGDLRWVIQKLKALLQDAEGDEDRLLQLGSLREIRQSLLALAELQGKLNKELTVHLNLNESPQFLTLREIILRVLDRHPEAKADFLDEMRVLKVLP